MNRWSCVGIVMVLSVLGVFPSIAAEQPPLSDATQDCIQCHVSATPGIVADWKRSRHSRITPADALKKPEQQRRVSAETIPEKLSGVAVGCAECHTLNGEAHKDAFDHNEVRTHLTVTPRDCATCHPKESSQYEKNLMSHARINLLKNPLYVSLMKSVNGVQTFRQMKTTLAEPDEKTNADSCLHCHGTVLEVKGKETRDTDYGSLEFPKIEGWPNQGVGRLNPDSSNGSCTSCHSRHQFAIEMARKPYTCSQCHKGPDVPAYKAYSVSKHGNLFSAMRSEWNFAEVPWTVGKDFVAPTCAVCHVSLLVTSEGDTVATRTHQMNDRLPWRILGLIYSHPHPKSPDTSIIKNKDGLPLPTTLRGEPASEFLIDPEEQQKRKQALQKVCLACHTKDWVAGHWERFEHTRKTTDQMVLTGTEIMLKAWEEKVADNKKSVFDEAIEKKWVEHWLFFANSTRFASAMMGADYGVFDEGRWNMAKSIQDMLEHLKWLMDNKARAR